MALRAEYNYNKIMDYLLNAAKEIKNSDEYKNASRRERKEADEYLASLYSDISQKQKALSDYYEQIVTAEIAEEEAEKGRAERKARRGTILGNIQNYVGDFAKSAGEHVVNDPATLYALLAQTVGAKEHARNVMQGVADRSDNMEAAFGRKAEWSKNGDWKPDSFADALDTGISTTIDMATLIYGSPLNAGSNLIGGSAAKAGGAAAKDYLLKKTGSKILSSLGGQAVNALPTYAGMSLPELYRDQIDYDEKGNVKLPDSVLSTYVLALPHAMIEHMGVDPSKPWTPTIKKSVKKAVGDWFKEMPKRFLGEGTEELLQDGIGLLDKRMSSDTRDDGSPNTIGTALEDWAQDLKKESPQLFQSFVLGGFGGAMMFEDVGNIKSNKEVKAQKANIEKQKNQILALTNNLQITQREEDRAKLLENIDKAIEGYDIKISDGITSIAEKQKLAAEKLNEQQQKENILQAEQRDKTLDLLDDYVTNMDMQNTAKNEESFLSLPFVDNNNYDYRSLLDVVNDKQNAQRTNLTIGKAKNLDKGKEEQLLSDWNSLSEEEQANYDNDFQKYAANKLYIEDSLGDLLNGKSESNSEKIRQELSSVEQQQEEALTAGDTATADTLSNRAQELRKQLDEANLYERMASVINSANKSEEKRNRQKQKVAEYKAKRKEQKANRKNTKEESILNALQLKKPQSNFTDKEQLQIAEKRQNFLGDKQIKESTDRGNIDNKQQSNRMSFADNKPSDFAISNSRQNINDIQLGEKFYEKRPEQIEVIEEGQEEQKSDNIIDSMINGEPIDNSVKATIDRLQNQTTGNINVIDKKNGKNFSIGYDKKNDSFTFYENGYGIIVTDRKGIEKKLNSGDYEIVSEGAASPVVNNQQQQEKQETKPEEKKHKESKYELEKRFSAYGMNYGEAINQYKDFVKRGLDEVKGRSFSEWLDYKHNETGKTDSEYKRAKLYYDNVIKPFEQTRQEEQQKKEEVKPVEQKQEETKNETKEAYEQTLKEYDDYKNRIGKDALSDSFEDYINKRIYFVISHNQNKEKLKRLQNAKEYFVKNIKSNQKAESPIITDSNNINYKDAVEKLSDKLGVLLTEAKNNTWLVDVLFGKKIMLDENKLRKLAQELFEGALCKYIRDNNLSLEQVLTIYKNQPTLNNRTQSQKDFQAYSTPVPLAKALTDILGIKDGDKVFEPTAGNGLLLSGITKGADFIVNELQDDRANILKAIFGDNVTQNNALKMNMPTSDFVVTNPPFGKNSEITAADVSMPRLKADSGVVNYRLTDQAHIIAANALKAMKADGKAVIIYGAPNGVFGKEGDVRKGGALRFETVLFNYYNVVGLFEVGGNLYSKQGTSFPIACIVIDGKRDTNHELYNSNKAKVKRLTSWEDVFKECDEIKQRMEEGKDVLGNEVTRLSQKQTTKEETKPVENKPVEKKAAEKKQTEKKEQKPQQKKETTITKELKEQANEKAKKETEKSPEQINEELAEGVKEAEAQAVEEKNTENKTESTNDKVAGDGRLQVAYNPVSQSNSIGALVPTNLAKAINTALKITQEAYGNLTDFVAKMVGKTRKQTQDSFAAEQIDVLSLYADKLINGSAMVCADQTGLGKGRVAAGAIQMSKKAGHIPMFCTEMDTLFSDIYRDMRDTGGEKLRPFFINAKGEMTYVDNGEIKTAYNKISDAERKRVLNNLHNGNLSDFIGEKAKYDYIVSTYSQFKDKSDSSTFKTESIDSLLNNGKVDMILDEAHNIASEPKLDRNGKEVKPKEGEEEGQRTYRRFMDFTKKANSILFLSATWAKRKGNMAIYNRAIGLDTEEINKQLTRGQGMIELLVMRMAMSGNYIRREQSFEGVTYTGEIVTKGEEAVKNEVKLSDEHNEIILDTIQLSMDISALAKDENFVRPFAVAKYGENAALAKQKGKGKELSASQGSTSPFNTLHNYIGNMLLSIKADRVADEAIRQIKAGLKPVIALEKTGGAQVDRFASTEHLTYGQKIKPMTMLDVFKGMMLGQLNDIPIETTTGEKGLKIDIPFDALPLELKTKYNQIFEKLQKTSLNELPGSPIDRIEYRIRQAGYTVEDITGRNSKITYTGDNEATFESIGKKDSKVIVNDFNSGNLDCVILNVKGATGISMHASDKFKDKKQRIMLIAQPFGDPNKMMQMLGRIHRVGQISKPIYKYVMTSLLQEIRQSVNLQDKLKSLNANTSSNKEGQQKFSDVDINNVYGQEAIKQWIEKNISIAMDLDLAGYNDKGTKIEVRPFDVKKVTGRINVTSQAVQNEFWDFVLDKTKELIAEADARGDNELNIPSYTDSDAVVLDSRKIAGETKADDYYIKSLDIQINGKPATIENAEARAKEGTTIANNKAAMEELENKCFEYLHHTDERIKNKKNIDINNIKNNIKASHRELMIFLNNTKIGEKAVNGNGEVGVITSIKVKPTKDAITGNPLTDSKIVITMATPTKTGTSILTLSSFRRNAWRTINEYSNSENTYFNGRWEEEYNQNSTHREKVEAITGNLLKALDFAVQNNMRVSQMQFRSKDGKGKMQFVYFANKIYQPMKNIQEITENDFAKKHYYGGDEDVYGNFMIHLWDTGAATIEYRLSKKNEKTNEFIRKTEEYLGKDSWSNNTVYIKDNAVDKVNRFIKDIKEDLSIQFKPLLTEKEKEEAIKESANFKNNLPQEFEEDDVHFSISQSKVSKAIGIDKLNAIAKKIGNALEQKLSLGLVVCKDSAELGNKLREAGAKIKSIPTGAEGCVFNGNVYLVADNIQEGNRVYSVLAHEIAGHVGAEKIYPHFNSLMKQLLKLENSDEKIKAIFDDVRKNYHIKDDEIKVASEVFAKVMEQVYENENSFTGKIKNLVNFFIKKVKDFFRNLFGMDIPMSASEVYAIANNIMKVTTVKSIMKGEVVRDKKYDASEVFKDEPVFTNGKNNINNELEQIKKQAIANNTFMKAPNGKQSNLNEKQWLMVRTQNFKKWFGDWEKAANWKAINELKPIFITDKTPNDIETIYKNLKNGKNKRDGREVRFVHSTLGKILRHKGFETAKIIPLLKEIFDNSVLLGTEQERQQTTRKDGTKHKEHRNFKGYANYVGKIKTNNAKEYYVRFTIQELNTNNKNYIPNELHSTYVSDVEIYEADKFALNTTNEVGKVGTVGYDNILSNYLTNLQDVSKNSSKVIDENGEPLLVYHGTESGGHYKFNADEYARAEKVTWFVDNEKVAYEYARNWESEQFDKEEGSQIYSCFLNIKNPVVLEANGKDYNSMESEIYKATLDKNHDGVIVHNIKDNRWNEGYIKDAYTGISNTYAVHNSNQIKSATDNIGTFDGNNDDIRFSIPSDNNNKSPIDKTSDKLIKWGYNLAENTAKFMAKYMINAYNALKKKYNEVPFEKWAKYIQAVTKPNLKGEDISEEHKREIFDNLNKSQTEESRDEFEEYLNERWEEQKKEEKEFSEDNRKSNEAMAYGKGYTEGYTYAKEEADRKKLEVKEAADIARIAKNKEKGLQYLEQQAKINKAIEEARKPKKTTIAQKFEALENWLAQKFADRRNRLAQFQADIEKATGTKLADYKNPYRQLDTIEGRIENKIEAFNDKYFKPLYDFLIKNKITYDDFNKFTYAMHADERDKYIKEINPTFKDNNVRGSGWDNAKMGGTTEQVLNKLYEKYGKDNLMKAGKMFWKMNDSVIDLQEEYGLITKETADNIRNRYKHYTPLKHIADDEVTTKVVERALGRTSTAQDNLMFATAAIDTTIRWGERNNAKLAMLNLVNLHKTPLVEVNRQKLEQYFNPNTGEVEVRLERNKEPNTIVARANGVNYKLTFKDDDLYTAFTSDNVGNNKAFRAIVTISRTFNSLMGFVSTVANPDFGIANFVRDQQQAGLENTVYRGGKFAGSSIANAFKSMLTYIQYKVGVDNADTRLYKEFLENGGMTGYADMVSLEKRAENLEKKINEDIEASKGLTGKVKKLAKHPSNIIHGLFWIFEEFNNTLESATRFGVYKEKRKTSSALEAAELSKNITINFNRHGDFWNSDMNGIYLFSNASIQGTRKAWQALKQASKSTKGKAMMGSLVMAGFASEILGNLFAGFDPDDKESYYDKLEEWKKDGNIIIFTGDKNYISIPLSPVIAVPYMAGRNMAAWTMGKKSMTKAFGDMCSNFITTLNPLGEDNRTLGSVVPTFFRPMIELWTNKKWYGGPIRPEQLQRGAKKPEHKLYFEKKTAGIFVDFAKWLSDITGGDEYTGGKLDYSPSDMQYLFEHYAGGLGKSVNKLYKLGTNQYGSWKDTPWEEVPMARRFYGETNDYGTAKEYKDNQQISNLFTKTKRERNTDYMKAHPEYRKIHNIISLADKRIDNIRDRIKMSESEKEAAITKIQKQANMAIKKLR